MTLTEILVWQRVCSGSSWQQYLSAPQWHLQELCLQALINNGSHCFSTWRREEWHVCLHGLVRVEAHISHCVHRFSLLLLKARAIGGKLCWRWRCKSHRQREKTVICGQVEPEPTACVSQHQWPSAGVVRATDDENEKQTVENTDCDSVITKKTHLRQTTNLMKVWS